MRKLVFVVTALLLLAECNSDRIAALEEQNKEVTKHNQELIAKLASANLDLQERCSVQARVHFNNYKSLPLSSYTNHYNASLNKCFMMLHWVDYRFKPQKTVTLSLIIIDAYEGKDYGGYMATTPTEAKGETDAPTRCEAIDPSGLSIKCKSKSEFDRMAKRFMEE